MIANWLPEDFLKATILFERGDSNSNLIPWGTGVLVNYKETFILVTCKHVVMNLQNKKLYEDLHFTVNRKDGSKFRYKILNVHRQFKIKWYSHKVNEVDLAVSPIAIEQNIDDIKTIPIDLFEDFNELPLGEDIFFLGYPLGLGTDNVSKVTPLVRGGLISSKNENTKSFWINANVYPGSSGSPVFYRPTVQDNKENSTRGKGIRLLGLINSNKNYKEFGLVLRTGEQRVLYEENAGLGLVFSSTLIKEILNYPHFKAMLTRATKPKNPPQGETIK